MKPQSSVIEHKYETRVCPCCSEPEGESLWAHSYDCNTGQGVFRWEMDVTCCVKCGFVYVSPAPTKESLERYYALTSPRFEGQAADYDLEKRLAFIQQLEVPEGPCIDIGGRDCYDFHARLRESFPSVHSVELNKNCVCEDVDLHSTEDSSISLACVYFVLEHVPDPFSFLLECRRVLKPGGRLIVEVPDIHLYPILQDGLVFYEHLNHFSIRTFERLARRAKFSLDVYSSEHCSREYGFVASLRVDAAPISWEEQGPDSVEILLSKACVAAGLARHRDRMCKLDDLRCTLKQRLLAGEQPVIWCANDISWRLLLPSDGLNGIVVVDSNPNKKFFFPHITVFLPDEAQNAVRSAKTIIVCSTIHAQEIKQKISSMRGGDMREVSIVVVGL